MSDHKQHLAALEKTLADIDAHIETYDTMLKNAGGRASPSFAAKLDDLRAERKRVIEHRAKVKLEDALSWSYSDSGALRFVDEVSSRLEHAIDHLDREKPGS